MLPRLSRRIPCASPHSITINDVRYHRIMQSVTPCVGGSVSVTHVVVSVPAVASLTRSTLERCGFGPVFFFACRDPRQPAALGLRRQAAGGRPHSLRLQRRAGDFEPNSRTQAAAAAALSLRIVECWCSILCRILACCPLARLVAAMVCTHEDRHRALACSRRWPAIPGQAGRGCPFVLLPPGEKVCVLHKHGAPPPFFPVSSFGGQFLVCLCSESTWLLRPHWKPGLLDSTTVDVKGAAAMPWSRARPSSRTCHIGSKFLRG